MNHTHVSGHADNNYLITHSSDTEGKIKESSISDNNQRLKFCVCVFVSLQVCICTPGGKYNLLKGTLTFVQEHILLTYLLSSVLLNILLLMCHVSDAVDVL